MSTPRNRLETTPVRQDTVCMCVHGRACSSFAPGHAVHLIQARLASATPGEWVDAIVTSTDASEGSRSPMASAPEEMLRLMMPTSWA